MSVVTKQPIGAPITALLPGYPGDLQTPAVYCPDVRPGNYLNVRLRGTSSNRDAVGARIVLRPAGREQHRLVSGGSNFGCSPYQQHFGLGKESQVEEIRVRWPSGLQQYLSRIPVNTTIVIVEGQDHWTSVDKHVT